MENRKEGGKEREETSDCSEGLSDRIEKKRKSMLEEYHFIDRPVGKPEPKMPIRVLQTIGMGL